MITTPFLGNGQEQAYTSPNRSAQICYKRGMNSYYEGDLGRAHLEALKALAYDSTFAGPYLLMGAIYRDREIYDSAAVAFRKAIRLHPDPPPVAGIYLADCEIHNQEYDQAIKHLEQLQSKPLTELKEKGVERLLERARFSKDAMAHPVPFMPQNMGNNINSSYDEYLPALTVDGTQLIITRNLGGGLQKPPGEDFFISTSEDGFWHEAVNIGAPINTDANEGAQCISADGQRLFFTGCNRRDGKGQCDIYMAKRWGKMWLKPYNLGYPVNTANWESQPSLSVDGRTMYYAANGKGSKGKTDIFVTHLKDDGKWSVPVSTSFSTEGSELSPFIHPDNRTLYFSSDAYPGMGGLDLFVVRKDSAGRWGKPLNLGYPINTPGDEVSLIVSPDGKTAYYASNREDAIGGIDIYSFELYEGIRAESVSTFRGRVFDAVSKKPMEASFELIDLSTGKVVVRSTSDGTTGAFVVALPNNGRYALNVSGKGYLFYSENFDMSGGHSASKVNEIPMKQIKRGAHVVLRNIFFDSGEDRLRPESKAELQKLISFLKANSSVGIEIGGHTDDVGSDEDNQLLSERRAKSVYEYLISNSIAAQRLTFRGYGESSPCAGNDTPEGRQQNRRTEFVVIKE